MSGSPLVGRAAEAGALAAAIDDVAGGGRRAVLLRGEAGVGKTRLLAELRALAGARLTVLAGRSTELERDVPLAAVAEALTSHVPDPEALVGDAGGGSPAERWRLHRAFAGALEDIRPGRPLALVLDDVHWADPATLELVEHLLRRPLARPHLIALAARPGEAAARLRAAAGARAATLELGPLGPAATEELVADVADPAERARLVRESGGNPLLLEELARAGGDGGLPGGLLDAVGRETARLGPGARRLLEGAAIAGDPFDLDLAGRVSGLEGAPLLTALDEAIAGGLVVETAEPRRFAFRHPVVRTAIHEGMPAGRRLAGHAAAAAALGAIGAPAPARAVHLAASAEPGDLAAAGVLREAAGAVRGRAPGTAASWLAAARRVDPGGGAARRVELAEALAQAGRLEEALEVADEDGEATAEEAVRLDVTGAGAERLLGRHDAARARLERALARGPGGPWEGRLLAELALSALERGDPGEMAARAEQARAAAPEDPVVRSAAAALLGFALLYAGRREDAARAVDVAVAGLERASAEEVAAGGDLPTALPWAALALERYPDALTTGRRVAEAARRRGDATAAVGPQAAAILALATTGRVAEAVRAAGEAEEAARLTGRVQPLQWALWMRAWALLEQGDLDAALAVARESASLAEELDESVLAAICRAVLGAVLIARGEHASGRALVAPYDADPGWICRWTPWVVAADLALGDVEAAGARADRAAALAEALGLAGARAAAGRAGAAVALARGDAAAATALARRAVEDAEAAASPLEAARGLVLLGRALGMADRDAAVAALEDGRRRAEMCGAGRLRDEAVRELRRLGRRVGAGGARRAGATGLASLTEREREIAGLVAAGLTNRQIGERMHLSEKTVETHLSRAFAKLGVRGRAALAARIAGG